MSQNQAELQDQSKTTGEPGRAHRGPGTLLRWFLIAFVIFAILGIYVVSQRLGERKALAQQTEQTAVPYVSVIHGTPIDANSEMVLPGTLKPFVESTIYART